MASFYLATITPSQAPDICCRVGAATARTEIGLDQRPKSSTYESLFNDQSHSD